jgi:hydrogenase maturation protein HypF
VLACGAELKNTFCLARDHYAFVSHHIGDLENLETLQSFTEGIDHFKRLFHIEPAVVAYDLHPEYLSTKYALSLDDTATKIAVQHHHAHIASCMADNQIDGEVIGVAMDGLGFGTDGRLWGGEFFVVDFLDAERVAHLRYVPMPGGAKAIREPWRMAAIYLQQAFGDEFVNLDLPSVKDLKQRGWPTLRSMVATRTNSPETSSMGRLFDAVSSLLGMRTQVNYEGQAAIELEAMADRNCTEAYNFQISSLGEIEASPVIRNAVEDLLDGIPAAVVSTRFHLGVANLIVSVAERVRSERRLSRIALSGGVFQNMLLLRKTCELLRNTGFQVFNHSRVPTNDGGISLGQAAIANAQIKSGRI